MAQQLDERREDFQHLAMMGGCGLLVSVASQTHVIMCFVSIACLNMVITLLFMFTLIRVWLQFGKGLADHCKIGGVVVGVALGMWVGCRMY